MGMDLKSRRTSGRDSYTWDMWRALFELGAEYGWVPAGTVLDDYELGLYGVEDVDGWHKKLEEEWNGSYFANVCQIVTEDDAQNWKKALEAAIADPVFLKSNGRPSLRCIKEFIDFLSDGEFRIW